MKESPKCANAPGIVSRGLPINQKDLWSGCLVASTIHREVNSLAAGEKGSLVIMKSWSLLRSLCPVQIPLQSTDRTPDFILVNRGVVRKWQEKNLYWARRIGLVLSSEGRLRYIDMHSGSPTGYDPGWYKGHEECFFSAQKQLRLNLAS